MTWMQAPSHPLGFPLRSPNSSLILLFLFFFFFFFYVYLPSYKNNATFCHRFDGVSTVRLVGTRVTLSTTQRAESLAAAEESKTDGRTVYLLFLAGCGRSSTGCQDSGETAGSNAVVHSVLLHRVRVGTMDTGWSNLQLHARTRVEGLLLYSYYSSPWCSHCCLLFYPKSHPVHAGYPFCYMSTQPQALSSYPVSRHLVNVKEEASAVLITTYIVSTRC